MKQNRSSLVSYVRKPSIAKVTPTKNEQQYSITYPPLYGDSFTESTNSLTLLPSILSTPPKQVRLFKKQQQKKTLSIVPISSNDARPSLLIDNSKIPKNDPINKKTVIITIVVSIIIGTIALAGMIISIYSLIRQTTSNTSTRTNNKNTSFSLRWMSRGVTVAGIGDATSITSDRLNTPYSLALDTANSIYIADLTNNRVQKWTTDAIQGTTVAGQASGAAGVGSNALTRPTGVIIDENSNIYVSDSGNNRVQFWANGASTGTTIAGTGTAGSGNGELNVPSGLARDRNTGTLYIADSSNHRVMKYTLGATTGTVAAGGNGPGLGSTQLAYPIGIYFDTLTDSLYITNFNSHTIVRWVLGASSWTLIGGNSNNVTGSTSTLLYQPVGIVFDPMGNIYVADAANHRIQLFMSGQSSGQTIAGVATTYGKFSSLLFYPYWPMLDNQLNLYVVDCINHRIQKFSRY